MKKTLILVVVAFILGLLWQASPARAQDAPAEVTLKASDHRLVFGKSTVLSGRVNPRMGGEEVNIVDDEGDVVATATTGDDGRYKVRFSPRANTTVTAQWTAAFSDPVALKVRSIVSAHLRGVKIFDDARVWGRVRPRHEGDSVTLKVKRGGRVVRTIETELRKGAYFKVKLPIDKPGSYKVTASFDDEDHLPAFDGTGWQSTRLPALSIGSRGSYVRLFERRLKRLGYYIPKANKSFDYKTRDAVIAFNKVQGRARYGNVTKSTWRALASPKTPKPRSNRPSFHIEVDQTKQVLYVVKKGKVEKILHVSTGAGGATHDGVYDFDRKLAGYSGNRLYYPSYFDGLRAIHGWPEVPTYPASHGCVRVPMWSATWIYGKIDIGDIIKIYH